MKYEKKQVIGLALGLALGLILYRSFSSQEDALDASIKSQAQEQALAQVRQYNIEELHSKAALSQGLDGEELIFSKNPGQVIYPAQFSKLMTCLIAAENLNNTRDSIVVPAYIFDNLREYNLNTAYLPGEHTQLRDLIFASLTGSNSDSALALALKVAGNQEDFVAMMNSKARDLGMENTKFSNPYGFDGLDEHTTVEDLALLVAYAYKNPLIKEALEAARYESQEASKHESGLVFINSLLDRFAGENLSQHRVLASMESYVEGDGLSLITISEYQDKKYLTITAGAGDQLFNPPLHILDTVNIFENY